MCTTAALSGTAKSFKPSCLHTLFTLQTHKRDSIGHNLRHAAAPLFQTKPLGIRSQRSLQDNRKRNTFVSISTGLSIKAFNLHIINIQYCPAEQKQCNRLSSLQSLPDYTWHAGGDNSLFQTYNWCVAHMHHCRRQDSIDLNPDLVLH